MKKNVKGKTLGRDAEHRRSLLRNLTVSLIEHGKVETTVAKAKYVRPFAEKLVTKAKKGKLGLLKKKLVNEKAIRKLIDEIAKEYKDRPGGYTRIVKLGRRDGDNSMMARIEWVKEEKEEKPEKPEKKEEPKEEETKEEVEEEKVEEGTEEPEEEEEVEEEKEKEDE